MKSGNCTRFLKNIQKLPEGPIQLFLDLRVHGDAEHDEELPEGDRADLGVVEDVHEVLHGRLHPLGLALREDLRIRIQHHLENPHDTAHVKVAFFSTSLIFIKLYFLCLPI